MDQRTLSKIAVHGSEDWETVLLAAVPATTLPPQYGGTNTQAEICSGGLVPGPGLGEALTAIQIGRTSDIDEKQIFNVIKI